MHPTLFPSSNLSPWRHCMPSHWAGSIILKINSYIQNSSPPPPPGILCPSLRFIIWMGSDPQQNPREQVASPAPEQPPQALPMLVGLPWPPRPPRGWLALPAPAWTEIPPAQPPRYYLGTSSAGASRKHKAVGKLNKEVSQGFSHHRAGLLPSH